MAGQQRKKKQYIRPELRRIKLSLAELTLGTNCDEANLGVQNAGCPPGGVVCNV
jgi:hypothetical protein